MTDIKVIRLARFQEFDSKRVVSQLLHDSERCRVVLFCLEPGQEVSPHESRSEVLLYGVAGRSTVSVGDEEVDLEPDTIVVCPPLVPHGMKATERTTILAVIAPRPE